MLENLKIGAYLRKDKAETEKDLEWVYSLFPRLKERSWQSDGTLSGGEQQLLACGAGASSGFIAQKMRKAAQKQVLDISIKAVSDTEIMGSQRKCRSEKIQRTGALHPAVVLERENAPDLV